LPDLNKETTYLLS